MKPISVIVVEDHDALRELTVDFLQSRGLEVRGVADGESLDEAMASAGADVVVLDVNLPGESGFDICRRLRSASPRLGLIMLTALGGAAQRVQGYEEGADLYLAKPTSQEELAAAVASLVRRTRGAESVDFVLDTLEQRLTGPAGSVSLTEAETRLLRGLALSSQQRLEYWQLFELLGMDDGAEAKAALEVRIVRLRRKLQAAGAAEPGIKALRMSGYQLLTSLTVA